MDAPIRHHRIQAKELYDWMHWHGLTQADLARGIGRSRSTIYNWLESQNRAPAELYGILCKTYGPPYVPEYGPRENAAVGLGRATTWGTIVVDPQGEKWVVRTEPNGATTYTRLRDDWAVDFPDA